MKRSCTRLSLIKALQAQALNRRGEIALDRPGILDGRIKGERDQADYKSIFYSLTDIGRRACAFHEKLLSVASAEIQDLIGNATAEEVMAIRGFITGMAERFGNISGNLEKIAVETTANERT